MPPDKDKTEESVVKRANSENYWYELSLSSCKVDCAGGGLCEGNI